MKKNKFLLFGIPLLAVFALVIWKLPFKQEVEIETTANESEKNVTEEVSGPDSDSPEATNEAERTSDFLLSADRADVIAWGRDFGLHDPIAGLAFIEGLDPESQAAQWFLKALFGAWTEEAPDMAVEHLLTYWKDEGVFKYLNYMTLPLEEWTRRDPLTAANRFQELSLLSGENWRMERATNFLLSRALATWAETAPQESFTWLMDQGNAGERSMILTAVIGEWAKVDPIKALEQVQLFEQGSTAIGFIRDSAITSWAANDSYAAAEWATANIPPEEFEQIWEASSEVAGSLYTQYSGDLAMNWVDKIPHKGVREEALGNLIFVWSSSTEEGTQLLDAFSEKVAAGDPLYESRLPKAAEKVAELDPVGVAEWLNNQETKSPVTDRFSEGLIDAIHRETPDVAYSWAADIQDEKLKSDMVYYVLTDWGYKDHESLNTWIQETQPELSPQLMKELKEIMEFSATRHLPPDPSEIISEESL